MLERESNKEKNLEKAVKEAKAKARREAAAKSAATGVEDDGAELEQVHTVDVRSAWTARYTSS